MKNVMPLTAPTASSLRSAREAVAAMISLAASGRTLTVSAWVPALPPHAGDHRHQGSQRDQLDDGALELSGA